MMAEETSSYPLLNHEIKRYEEASVARHQIVTVFLLTHQRPALLGKMIRSILSQTYRNFCLVVLDNVSGDETKEVVTSTDDDRVFYCERESIQDEPNFWFAFRICRTRYLTVFHDDDLVAPSYLENMVSAMEHNRDICALSSYHTYISDKSDFPANYEGPREIPGEIIRFSKTDYLEKFIEANDRKALATVLFPAFIYRRCFFRENSRFRSSDVGPCGDEYLYLQIERFGGTFGCLRQVLYYYRKSSIQDSAIRGDYMHFQLLRFLFRQEYYRPYMMAQAKHLGHWMLFYLVRILESGRPRAELISRLKKTYKYIPHEIMVGKRNKRYAFMFSLARFCPWTVRFLIRKKSAETLRRHGELDPL